MVDACRLFVLFSHIRITRLYDDIGTFVIVEWLASSVSSIFVSIARWQSKVVLPFHSLTAYLSNLKLFLDGFNRISSGPDEGGYYHELFLRGRPKLTCHMRRVGVSYPTVMLPSGVKIPRADGRRARKSFFGTDPDFYAMRPISLDPDKAVGEVKQNENGNGEKPKEEGTNMQSVASDTALKTGDTSLGPKPVENDAQPSIGRLETALEVAQATDTTAKPVAHESAVSSLSKPLGGQDIVSETQSSEVFEVKSETSSQSDNNYAAALPISPGAANDPMKLLALGD